MGGRAKRPLRATDGRLVATEVSPQRVLEELWAALLVMYESVAQVLGVSVLPGHPGTHCGGGAPSDESTRFKESKGAAWEAMCQGEVTGRGLEDRGSETQALESFRSCVGEAGPPTLQTVALAALTGDPSGWSVQHVVRLLKEGGKSQAANLSQGKERSTVSGASPDCGEPPGRKTTAGSNDSPDPQGPAHPRAQGPASCRRRAQAKVEDEGRRELRNPGGQRVAGETGANSTPWTRTRRRRWPCRGSLGLTWKAGGLGSSGEQGGRALRRPRPPVGSPSILSSSPPAVVTSKHPRPLPKQRKKSRPGNDAGKAEDRGAHGTNNWAPS